MDKDVVLGCSIMAVFGAVVLGLFWWVIKSLLALPPLMMAGGFVTLAMLVFIGRYLYKKHVDPLPVTHVDSDEVTRITEIIEEIESHLRQSTRLSDERKSEYKKSGRDLYAQVIELEERLYKLRETKDIVKEKKQEVKAVEKKFENQRDSLISQAENLLVALIQHEADGADFELFKALAHRDSAEIDEEEDFTERLQQIKAESRDLE